MEHVDVNQLPPGSLVEGLKFAVLSVTQKQTSTGSDYWVVELMNPQGKVSARVWSDAMPQVKLQPNKVARIWGQIDQYRGTKSLAIHRGELVDEEIEPYLVANPTLVFDIETVGKPFEELDKTEQAYLTDNLERNFTGSEEELKQRTGLYPLFAFVAAIGMYNPSTQKGQVLCLSNGKKSNKIKLESSFEAVMLPDEAALLRHFWETSQHYYRYVTFNGHGFDFPFLLFRSAVNRVRVPYEIGGSSDRFVDLATKFRLNYRSFKLEMVCKALGISNPKAQGVSGMEVSRLYYQGKMDEIARYVARDVVSTSELYDIWRQYLAGKLIY